MLSGDVLTPPPWVTGPASAATVLPTVQGQHSGLSLMQPTKPAQKTVLPKSTSVYEGELQPPPRRVPVPVNCGVLVRGGGVERLESRTLSTVLVVVVDGQYPPNMRRRR